MQAIKALTPEDYQFEYAGIIMDATKVVVLWNETTGPLSARYEALTPLLTVACGKSFTDADSYLIMEVAVRMVGELKKRLSS